MLVAVFAFALPQFANYGSVLEELRDVSGLDLALIVAASALSGVTVWWINQAALPGLRFWPSAAVTQSGYAVTNTVPAGGALSIGLTYQILRSFGFRTDDVVLMMGVGGIWNFFGKFIVPVLAVGLLLVTGERTEGMAAAVITAVLSLLAVLFVLFLVLWKESLARRVGNALGHVASWLLHWFHRGPVTGGGDEAVSFRQRTIGVIRKRWALLTITAVANQLSFFVVLLIALRGVGVSEKELPVAGAFAAFAFGRLASAVPITPGGIGTTELAFTGLLVAAGGPRTEVVAAVLVFRVFTYLLPIPVGAITYLGWRRWANRHRPATAAAGASG